MSVNFTSLFYPRVNRRVIILIIIIIQSCGIRFFNGQGTFLSAVVILLSIKGFKFLQKRDLRSFGVILLFLLVSYFTNQNFQLSGLVFQYTLVVEAYLFLLGYRDKDRRVLASDLYNTLHFIFLNALIGYILYFITPSVFNRVTVLDKTYLTLFNVFYLTQTLNGAVRNTGLLWEPGLLQLFLNLFLFYSIRKSSSNTLLLLIVCSVLSTGSTAGYLILAVNCIYFIIRNFKRRPKLIVSLLTLLTIFSGVLYFMIENITDKLGGENTSGLVRYRDFSIGLELIYEKPMLGHGLFDNKYLLSKGFVRQLESELFSIEYINESGEMGGGFTNGLLGVFCWYGIPFGVLIFVLFYKNRFVGSSNAEKLIWFFILCMSLISEPISYTSFFLLFPLSAWVLHKERISNFLTYE